MRLVVDLGYPSAWENPYAMSVLRDKRVMGMETFLCQLALLQFLSEY